MGQISNIYRTHTNRRTPSTSTRPPLKIRIEKPIFLVKGGVNGSCIGKNSIIRPPKMSGKKIVDPSSIGVYILPFLT